MNCDTFTGGYCEKTDMHVPRSWCLEMCQYYNKIAPPVVKQVIPKPAKPTLPQMAEHFTKAMARWAAKGFKTVTKEEYNRRRLICNDCSGGWRCPKCGCLLWAKAALETETCDKWTGRMKDFPYDMYKGQECYLILNGPSMSGIDKSFFDGKITMCVNNGGILKPTLWTSVDTPSKFNSLIWKDPDIIKFVSGGKRKRGIAKGSKEKVSEMPNINYYKVVPREIKDWFLDDGVAWKIRHNGKSKISVMFAAMNILCKLGFTTINLLGADFNMTVEKPYFFDDKKDEKGVRHNMELYRFQNEVFTELRPLLEEHGVKVYNRTPNSGLTAFEYKSI